MESGVARDNVQVLQSEKELHPLQFCAQLGTSEFNEEWRLARRSVHAAWNKQRSFIGAPRQQKKQAAKVPGIAIDKETIHRKFSRNREQAS